MKTTENIGQLTKRIEDARKIKSPKGSKGNKKPNAEIKSINVFQIIDEKTCQRLLTISDDHEMEEIFVDLFNVDDPKTSMKSALLVDYYCTFVKWYCEKMEESSKTEKKFAIAYTLFHGLLESILKNEKSLIESVLELQKLSMNKNTSEDFGISEFNGNELSKIVDFISTGIYSHYHLFNYVATFQRAEKILGGYIQVNTMIPYPMSFPSPLSEAILENTLNQVESHNIDECTPQILTPSIDQINNQTEREIDTLGSQIADLIPEINIELIQKIMHEEANNLLLPIGNEMEIKIEELEAMFLKKLDI